MVRSRPAEPGDPQQAPPWMAKASIGGGDISY